MQDNDFAQSQSRYVIHDFFFVYGGWTSVTAEHFEIHQHQEDGRLRLQLTGELDMASGPGLEKRLERLRADKQPVRLDLSRLAFMDSTGIHLLIGAFNQARADGWQFEVDPDLSPQVEVLFGLTDMDRIIRGHARTASEGLERVVV